MLHFNLSSLYIRNTRPLPQNTHHDFALHFFAICLGFRQEKQQPLFLNFLFVGHLHLLCRKTVGTGMCLVTKHKIRLILLDLRGRQQSSRCSYAFLWILLRRCFLLQIDMEALGVIRRLVLDPLFLFTYSLKIPLSYPFCPLRRLPVWRSFSVPCS